MKYLKKYNSEINEGLKQKIASGLIGLSMMVSSCDSITPEEKQRLQTEIESLSKQEQEDRKKVDFYDAQVESKKRQVQLLDDEVKHLASKIGILKKGKKPLYVLTLYFFEQKGDPLDLDRIKFEFEIPVDEDYYKNCKEGDVLGQDNRFMSIFHKGTITIQKKEIR
jgi:hypothetical protein